MRYINFHCTRATVSYVRGIRTCLNYLSLTHPVVEFSEEIMNPGHMKSHPHIPCYRSNIGASPEHGYVAILLQTTTIQTMCA